MYPETVTVWGALCVLLEFRVPQSLTQHRSCVPLRAEGSSSVLRTATATSIKNQHSFILFITHEFQGVLMCLHIFSSPVAAKHNRKQILATALGTHWITSSMWQKLSFCSALDVMGLVLTGNKSAKAACHMSSTAQR